MCGNESDASEAGLSAAEEKVTSAGILSKVGLPSTQGPGVQTCEMKDGVTCRMSIQVFYAAKNSVL